jgi:hypothetical protein
LYCVSITGPEPSPAPGSDEVDFGLKPKKPPGKTEAGITKECTNYYKGYAGDTCDNMAQFYGDFTAADFKEWNPYEFYLSSHFGFLLSAIF